MPDIVENATEKVDNILPSSHLNAYIKLALISIVMGSIIGFASVVVHELYYYMHLFTEYMRHVNEVFVVIIPVFGITVAYVLVTKWRMRRMVGHINDFMRKYDKSVPKLIVKPDDLYLLGDYLGEEYACFTEEGCSVVDEMRDLEGIPLEQTYTGKALAGGLDWLKKKGEQEKTVLFWNTYNSVDLSANAATIDYKTLPMKFHKYFEEPTQEETFVRR